MTRIKKRLIDTAVVLIVIAVIVAVSGIAISNISPKVEYIAHRGYSSIAPENTAPAYEEAGKADFWGAECDVYRTKDGVWVLSHDKTTEKMLNSKYLINDTSYNKLAAENVKYGNNIENYPDLKMCTLDEYLQICKKYDMVAVIEVKDENNTAHCDEIVNLVEKHKVEAVYISEFLKILWKFVLFVTILFIMLCRILHRKKFNRLNLFRIAVLILTQIKKKFLKLIFFNSALIKG